jgi:hypothetical protein
MPGKIANPPTLSQTTFTSGTQAKFTASGANLTLGVGTVVITSSNATWSPPTATPQSDILLCLTSTPTVNAMGPTGDLTITINKNTANQSSGTATGITYNAASD